MEVEELNKLLNLSWCKETCVPSLRDKWSEDNKSLGQSDITSRVVYDFYGGNILKCDSIYGDHYFNIVGDKIIDFTKDQFEGELPEYENSIEATDYVLYSITENDIKKRNDLLMDKIVNNYLSYKKYKLLDGNGQEYLSYDQGTILGNKKTKKYGRMDCPKENNWFKNFFEPENKVYFASEEDAINAGYRPCQYCMPREYEEWKNNKKKLVLKK